MAQVQFSVRTKYAGAYQPPHTPFVVKNSDVPDLIASGATVVVSPEQDPDPETEEVRAARLLAAAQAEEDRIAAEEAEKSDAGLKEETPEEGATEPAPKSRATKDKEK